MGASGQQNFQQAAQIGQYNSFYEIFAAMPKFIHPLGDYGLELFELEENEGFVLAFSECEETDIDNMREFFQTMDNMKVENIEVRKEALAVKFLRPEDLAELLLTYLDQNPHQLEAEMVASIYNEIDMLIKRSVHEHMGGAKTLDHSSQIEGQYMPEDMICDTFNTILEKRGLKGAEAYYQECDEVGEYKSFEISIDYDGNDPELFEKFAEEFIECAEEAGVVPSQTDGQQNLFLMAENAITMLKVLRAYCDKHKLATVEDMVQGGVVCDKKSVYEDGRKYLKSLSEEESFRQHPMVSTAAGNNDAIATLFYLKANEPFPVNLDAIETAILQRDGNYKALEQRHRPFIVH